MTIRDSRINGNADLWVFGDDSPLLTMIIVRENSEVVMKFTHDIRIHIYIYIHVIMVIIINIFLIHFIIIYDMLICNDQLAKRFYSF